MQDSFAHRLMNWKMRQKKKKQICKQIFYFFTIYKGKCEDYTIALRKIKGLHATTDEIIQIIMNIEKD